MKLAFIFSTLFVALNFTWLFCEASTPKSKQVIDTSYVSQSGCTVQRFRIYSSSMKRDVKVAVVLPPAYQTNKRQKFPVLYTLHGSGAPYDTYAAMPLLQNELKEKPFIYTCFDGDTFSMYVDSKYPVKNSRDKADTTKRTSLFTTFFFREFIPALDKMYRIDKTKRGLTGFSMGGYGAMHYGLAHPEMFCSVSGLSSVFLDASSKGDAGRLKAMLGPYEENKADYEALDHYKRVAAIKSVPAFYFACGTEDPLIAQSRKMKDHLQSLGIPVEYREAPGLHNFAFWHPESVRVAEFHWKSFQQKKEESKADYKP